MDFLKDDLKTGIEDVDSVHADLVRLAKSLQRAVAEGCSAEEVEALLTESESYAHQDFLHEESCMRETGFPGYAAHKQEHESLAGDVERLKAELYTSGPTSGLAIRLQRRIREWLVVHLNLTDRQLSDHLNHGI